MKYFKFAFKNWKWLAIGITLALFTIGFWLLLPTTKYTPKNSVFTPTSNSTNLDKFFDPELGIEFFYPQNWGSVEKIFKGFITTSPYNIGITLGFEKNKDVLFTVQVGNEPDAYRVLYENADAAPPSNIESGCGKTTGENISYRVSDEYSSMSNNDSTFKPHQQFLGPYYLYSIKNFCTKNVIVKITAHKDVAEGIKNQILISKDYFIAMGNPLASWGNFSIQLPPLESQDYCVTYNGKEYGCITYQEKQKIDNIVALWEQSEKGEEIKNLVASIKQYPVSKQNAMKSLESHFSKKQKVIDQSISFESPSIIGDYPEFRISSRDDAIQADQQQAEGTGHPVPSDISLEEWDNDYTLYASYKGTDEQINCGDRFECQFVTFGKNIFLVKFDEGYGPYGYPHRDYILYRNNLRFVFLSFPWTNVLGSSSVEEFAKLERASIKSKIILEMIKSVEFVNN